MGKFFGRHRPRKEEAVDPKVLVDQANEINEKLEREAPKLTALETYLKNRRMQNGFGTDFEYTLRPKEAS